MYKISQQEWDKQQLISLKIGSCETTWVASASTPCAVILDQWSSAAKTWTFTPSSGMPSLFGTSSTGNIHLMVRKQPCSIIFSQVGISLTKASLSQSHLLMYFS